MIYGKTILAIIPARKGSKRLKNKNVKIFCGKPLVYWSLLCAKSSNFIDKIVVSSDDDEVLKFAKLNGFKDLIKRPAKLSKNNTQMIDVVLHTISLFSNFDIVILLQPTSPLRRSVDVDMSIKKMIKSKSKSCVSIIESKINPIFLYKINSKGKLLVNNHNNSYDTNKNLKNNFYRISGDIYISFLDQLKEKKTFFTRNTSTYLMPEIYSSDIDNVNDFSIAELIKKNLPRLYKMTRIDKSDKK